MCFKSMYNYNVNYWQTIRPSFNYQIINATDNNYFWAHTHICVKLSAIIHILQYTIYYLLLRKTNKIRRK